MLIRFRSTLFAAVALCASAAAMAQTPSPDAPLSVDTFFQPDTMRSVRVSPSGRWMAIQSREPGSRTKLTIVDLENKEPARIVAKFTRFDVESPRWVNDDYLVFGLSDENDGSGKVYGQGLYSVRRDGERIRELIKRRYESAFQEQGKVALEPSNHMLANGAPGTNDIVIGEDHYDTNYVEYEHTTLRTLDVGSGDVRSMFRELPAPPARIVSWLIDAKGRARVAVAHQGEQSILYWADAQTGAWRKLAQYASLNAPFAPAYIDDKDQLFVTAVNPATSLSELHLFDLAAGKPAEAAIVSLPGFDAEPTPIQDRGDNKVYGLRLLTDAASVAWLSPTMSAIQARVDKMLPGRVNVLGCHPCSAPKVVSILSYSDTNPGDFLLYYPAQDKFERIGAARPGHPEKRMANLELYRTKTRDGADLPV